MKVLVATSRTQGARYNDFDYCVEGELVWFEPSCDHGDTDSADLCGWCRSFSGLSSHRATTTARVAELDISPQDYLLALSASLDEQGWTGHLDAAHAEAKVVEIRDSLAGFADLYPVDTVMEVEMRTATTAYVAVRSCSEDTSQHRPDQ